MAKDSAPEGSTFRIDTSAALEGGRPPRAQKLTSVHPRFLSGKAVLDDIKPENAFRPSEEVTTYDSESPRRGTTHVGPISLQDIPRRYWDPELQMVEGENDRPGKNIDVDLDYRKAGFSSYEDFRRLWVDSDTNATFHLGRYRDQDWLGLSNRSLSARPIAFRLFDINYGIEKAAKKMDENLTESAKLRRSLKKEDNKEPVHQEEPIYIRRPSSADDGRFREKIGRLALDEVRFGGAISVKDEEWDVQVDESRFVKDIKSMRYVQQMEDLLKLWTDPNDQIEQLVIQKRGEDLDSIEVTSKSGKKAGVPMGIFKKALGLRSEKDRLRSTIKVNELVTIRPDSDDDFVQGVFSKMRINGVAKRVVRAEIKEREVRQRDTSIPVNIDQADKRFKDIDVKLLTTLLSDPDTKVEYRKRNNQADDELAFVLAQVSAIRKGLPPREVVIKASDLNSAVWEGGVVSGKRFSYFVRPTPEEEGTLWQEISRLRINGEKLASRKFEMKDLRTEESTIQLHINWGVLMPEERKKMNKWLVDWRKYEVQAVRIFEHEGKLTGLAFSFQGGGSDYMSARLAKTAFGLGSHGGEDESEIDFGNGSVIGKDTDPEEVRRIFNRLSIEGVRRNIPEASVFAAYVEPPREVTRQPGFPPPTSAPQSERVPA